MTKPLSSRAYAKNSGVICPNCRTMTVSGGERNTDDGIHTQNCSCDTCGAEWTDVYILKCYDNLTVPPKQTNNQPAFRLPDAHTT
jgi:hypothetical protein